MKIFWCLSGKYIILHYIILYYTLFYSFRIPIPENVSGTGKYSILNIHVTFVLLIWGLFGGLILHFFLANFLTVLLLPQYEDPIDSAEDIVDRGMIPFTEPGAVIYTDLLLQSPNPLYQYLGTIVVHPRQKGGGWGVYMKMCKEDVHGANTHVFLGNLRPHYEEYGYGKWHKSTDNLEGLNPYTVNIYNEKWEFSDAYDHHLLLFHQVRLFKKNNT